MTNKGKYKIKSLRDVGRGFEFPRKEKLFKFWKTIFSSCKKSKLNLFFQFINLLLIWILILIILPGRFNEWFVYFFGEVRLWFLPVSRLIISFISYIITKTVLGFFTLSWSDIFETGFKISISLTVSLGFLSLLLFNKLFAFFLGCLSQDLNLWKTNK